MATQTHPLTRTVEGRELPATGTWSIDTAHTSVEFVARHLMVTKVRGSFDIASGTVRIEDDPTDSQVDVVLDAASVSSGTEDRDGHLRSADFLDVESYPEIRFVSTAVVPKGSGWAMNGDLTIKDVTRPASLDFEYLGLISDPWGNGKAAFTASTEVEREDWGLTWNVPLEGGGLLVSKTVKIEIQVQATLES